MPVSKTDASYPMYARVDIRTLAMLVDWYQKMGVVIPTKSALVSNSLEVLIRGLLAEGAIEEIVSVVDAIKTLELTGMISKEDIQGRSGSKIARMIQKETVERSGLTWEEVAGSNKVTVRHKDSRAMRQDSDTDTIEILSQHMAKEAGISIGEAREEIMRRRASGKVTTGISGLDGKSYAEKQAEKDKRQKAALEAGMMEMVKEEKK